MSRSYFFRHQAAFLVTFETEGRKRRSTRLNFCLLPAGLEKSRTLVAGCSRSGLLDDRFPGIGMMATL